MFYDQVKEAADFIRQQISIGQEEQAAADTGLILGSGLGGLVDAMEGRQVISYREIPNFPVPQVEGHEGNLVFGRIGTRKIAAMQGRFHYYEGFSMKEVAFPVFVMKLLGVENLIVTNACGGINRNFQPGDLMLLTDFINGVSDNPLRGANDERFGPRFPDMTESFSHALISRAQKTAEELGLSYQKGVYALFQGPYYETAAEIRAFAVKGADAIGMSTVPEVIAANYLGMQVLGIACITNMATGIAAEKHSHEEVLKVAQESSERLCTWLTRLLRTWERE